MLSTSPETETIEAELKSVRRMIIDFVDSGAQDNEPITVTNGDLCRWFDRLEIVSAHLRNGLAQTPAVRGDLSDSPLPWVFDEGNGAGPDEKEMLPCIADAHGNIIMQIFLDDPYGSPRVAEKIAAMRVAVDAVNRGVPDGLLMQLLHKRLNEYEQIASSKIGLTDLGKHAHLAFKIFRDSCVAALTDTSTDREGK